MNWILVILQVAATNSSTGYSYHNWTAIGEFQSEKACVAASAKLAQATQDVRGIKNVQCLKKD